MPNNQINILNRLSGIEAMARNMLQEAAMLRQEVEAGGQLPPSRKGKKVNLEIAGMAKTRLTSKILKSKKIA